VSHGRQVDAENERTEREVARVNLERVARELVELVSSRGYPAAVSVDGLRNATEHASRAILALRSMPTPSRKNDPMVAWVKDPLRAAIARRGTPACDNPECDDKCKQLHPEH
jgi:hypothetical protein